MLWIFYGSALLFLVLSGYKAYVFAKMPLHGRMELYPVPKEKGKSEYGGSYFEEVEWWRKPRELSGTGELKDMFKEMLLIKKLFQNQRSLWWVSYALHLGIYFLAAWTVLLIIGALSGLAGMPISAGGRLLPGAWPAVLYYLTALCGNLGFACATFGAAALLWRRAFDPVLRKYTTPQEYFNLLLLLAALVSGLIVWLPDIFYQEARTVMADFLSLTPPQATGALTLHVILAGFMFIYIPLSKMSHYVGKYFTFHKVLWENDPNLPGSAIEKKVQAALGYKPGHAWSAPHVQTVRPQNQDR